MELMTYQSQLETLIHTIQDTQFLTRMAMKYALLMKQIGLVLILKLI